MLTYIFAASIVLALVAYKRNWELFWQWVMPYGMPKMEECGLWSIPHPLATAATCRKKKCTETSPWKRSKLSFISAYALQCQLTQLWKAYPWCRQMAHSRSCRRFSEVYVHRCDSVDTVSHGRLFQAGLEEKMQSRDQANKQSSLCSAQDIDVN